MTPPKPTLSSLTRRVFWSLFGRVGGACTKSYLCRNHRRDVNAQTHKRVRVVVCQPPSIVRDDTDRATPTLAWVFVAVRSEMRPAPLVVRPAARRVAVRIRRGSLPPNAAWRRGGDSG